jgi:hypothetical protein
MAETHNFVLVRVGEVGDLGLGLQIGRRTGGFVKQQEHAGEKNALAHPGADRGGGKV